MAQRYFLHGHDIEHVAAQVSLDEMSLTVTSDSLVMAARTESPPQTWIVSAGCERDAVKT